jgi:LPXTG-motif cell wall-anchored protein
MRRSLMLVLMVVLAALVFVPAALAQDDNPTGDDLGGDDRGGERGFDDNPTGDDIMSSPTSAATPTTSATPTATSTPTAGATVAAAAQYKNSATALPDTGGSVPTAVLAIGAGALLVGGGLLARRFMG